MNASEAFAADAQAVKQCCAAVYESDLARLLLGDSYHPGGLRLTERLGVLLGLTAESRVLDVAAGRGASAIFLAERFGCQVEGIDYGPENVEQATAGAAAKGLSARVRFQRADAERLPFEDGAFDAVICECAFCTFPDKPAAAREFARVLRPGGFVGLSDLTRGPELASELEGLLAWIACIADAQPVEVYEALLSEAGLRTTAVETHDDALLHTVEQVRLKLLGVEIAAGLKKLDLPDIDLPAAKAMARASLEAIGRGELGFSIVCGRRS